MCVAVPGRVVEVSQDQGMAVGLIAFGENRRRVSLDLLPDTVVGDYVLVYTGFAISKVTEEEAQAVLELHAELEELGLIES